MINIHEAKTQFSKLVRRAAEGEEIIIARGGEPAARLVPLDTDKQRPPRVPDDLKGAIWVSEDCWAPDPETAAKFGQ